MKQRGFTPRVLALLVALTISLPPPAFALREIQTKDSGLEQKELAAALLGSTVSTAAGLEERTLTARMDRLMEMIQHYRRADPQEPWSGNPQLLRSLDEMEGFVKGFREQFGSNPLDDYLRFLSAHDFVASIRSSPELPPQSAPALLAYAELLDNLRKAVSRISEFPQDRILFLSPDDYVGWLSVSGRDVAVLEENEGTGDWRLGVHAPAGMHIRTDGGRGQVVNLIALLAGQRPLWEILYSAYHEAAHDLQMQRPERLNDESRYFELYTAVGEGGQRRRETVYLRQFLENPEPVTPLQLYALLRGTTWNLMMRASERTDLDPEQIAPLVNFFGTDVPRPIPGEVMRLILQPSIFDALFPTQYVHETWFEQALRGHPEIGPAAVEALDLQDDPEPLRAALGPERYEALAEFLHRWRRIFADEIGRDQRSVINGLRFRIAQEVILNPLHPSYRAEYAQRLTGPVVEEIGTVGADAITSVARFHPDAIPAVLHLAAEFVRTQMPVETFRTRLRQILPAAGLEERVPVWLEAALGADWMKVIHGVHETAQVTDKVAVLIQPELLGVAEGDGDTEVALMAMEGNLHGAFGWPDETKLRLGLLTSQSVEAYEDKGYRVIRLLRHPESEERPLPWEAVPVVVAQALAGGRPTFWVNVTPYLNLKGITLPEILSTLTDLFA